MARCEKNKVSFMHNSYPGRQNNVQWCTIVQGILLPTCHSVHCALFGSFDPMCIIMHNYATLCYFQTNLWSMVQNIPFKVFLMGLFACEEGPNEPVLRTNLRRDLFSVSASCCGILLHFDCPDSSGIAQIWKECVISWLFHSLSDVLYPSWSCTTPHTTFRYYTMW